MTYIPIRKIEEEYYHVINLSSKRERTDNNILLEAVHAFDEQYKWARDCAELVYEAILEGDKTIKVDFTNNKDELLNGVIITIDNNVLLKTAASFDNISDDGWGYITIYARKKITEIEKETAITEIWNAIVHELGHGNIFWKRIVNGQDINDTPDDYEKWINAINNNDNQPNDILYLFCYALYSTCYQEIQAYISGTYSDTVVCLQNMKGTNKNITKEDFWTALVNTSTYQAFKSNINIANTLLDSNGLRNILGRKLENYGLQYDDNKIVKLCDNILKRSNYVLKAAYNNAYYFLHKEFID